MFEKRFDLRILFYRFVFGGNTMLRFNDLVAPKAKDSCYYFFSLQRGPNMGMGAKSQEKFLNYAFSMLKKRPL